MPCVYHWHPTTLFLCGVSEADGSPLEPGVFLIPAHATTLPPPAADTVPSGHVVMWDIASEQWKTKSQPLEPVKEDPAETAPPADAATQLRDHRNALLSQSDWVAIKYFTRGEPFPAEWAAYFQALRDLPAVSTPTLHPDGTLDMNSVIWPEKPSSV